MPDGGNMLLLSSAEDSLSRQYAETEYANIEVVSAACLHASAPTSVSNFSNSVCSAPEFASEILSDHLVLMHYPRNNFPSERNQFPLQRCGPTTMNSILFLPKQARRGDFQRDAESTEGDLPRDAELMQELESEFYHEVRFSEAFERTTIYNFTDTHEVSRRF
jgi:hypothetical protein